MLTIWIVRRRYSSTSRAPARIVFVSEPDEVQSHGRKLWEQVQASYDEALEKGQRVARPEELLVDWDTVSAWLEGATALETLALTDEDPRTVHIGCQPAVEFSGRVQDWVEEIRRGRERGDTMVLVAHTPGRAERTIELLADYEIFAVPMEHATDAHAAAVLVGIGHLSRGFRLPEAQLQLWAETDVFEEERKVHERRKSATRTFLSDFRDLKAGDLVVHIDHGIGHFVGLKRIDVGLDPQEFMELRYAGEDKLFVPVERLDLVQKYTGAARAGPRSAGRHDVGEGQDARQEGDARHGRGAAQALRRAQSGPGPRVQPGHALAAGVRGRVRVGAHAGSTHRRHRHQGRHGVAVDDGSAAVR